MPVMLRISVDDAAARADLKGFERKRVARIAARAINATTRQTVAEGAKVAAKLTGLRSKAARERFAVRRASPDRPVGSVTVSHKAINLIEFVAGRKPPKRKPKVGVRAKAWGTSRVYPRTFFVPVRKRRGGVGYAVMKRAAGAGRLPIEPVYGPSVYQALKRAREDEALGRFATRRFAANMAREIDRERYSMGRRRKR